ncbi:MAG: hypothetical protein Solumvirus3_5 [Solumvirus sp.]|uniref:Uncharacterized protein n=1 Tax=Solumvirus sp. TaxID=2487773 RepID=A0A3G5AKC1_9VIRU|nr:MAG: hypothetical protein Solumvirus3_5 [Solumvirus sp.]
MSAAAQPLQSVELPPEGKFKANVAAMCKLFKMLAEEVNKQNNIKLDVKLMDVVSAAIDTYDAEKIIETFIPRSLGYWDKLISVDPDKSFLMQNATVVFKDFPTPNVKDYQEAFNRKKDDGTDLVGPNYTTAIWKYLRTLIKFCIIYISNKRKIDTQYHSIINLQEWAPKFDAKL